MPATTDRDEVLEQVRRISGRKPVTDLIEVADYPAPAGWEDALGFALSAMERLPRAKVSVEAGRVSVTAITDSAQEKADLDRGRGLHGPARRQGRARPPANEWRCPVRGRGNF